MSETLYDRIIYALGISPALLDVVQLVAGVLAVVFLYRVRRKFAGAKHWQWIAPMVVVQLLVVSRHISANDGASRGPDIQRETIAFDVPPAPVAGRLADTDRSDLSLPDALAGHWYMEEFDKNEFFELVAGGRERGSTPRLKMTWDTRNGTETSDGAILHTIALIDEQENTLILSHKSLDGEFVYFTSYTFSPKRTTVVVQDLDARRQPKYSPSTMTYVSAAGRSQFVK